MKDILLNLGY